MSQPSAAPPTIPVLLLKTKSTPSDAYQDLFSADPDAPAIGDHGSRFSSRFVPVLQHRFEESGMSKLRSWLRTGAISASSSQERQFGGLIFTSQRAVEAFTQAVREEQDARGSVGDAAWPRLQGVPVYSVGPATTRCLKAIPTPLQIFGEHTGNGEALAQFIQSHYTEWHRDQSSTNEGPSAIIRPPPPLLFLVGEQRRDIIPKTLMNEDLAPEKRIQVTEEVVYGTGIMESFQGDFTKVLEETDSCAERWVVVFSPTGCESMLRCLGLLDTESSSGGKGVDGPERKTFIVTIGPTTQSYLRTTFGFDPDVSAGTPSPQGVLDAILDFKSKRV
jgi:uroporphyrinogen-III synthase